MKYPLDELMDKRSILLLKIERIDDQEVRERLWKEFSDYTVAIWGYINEGVCTIDQVEEWHKELYETNGKMWDLEADIRGGKEGTMSLEEVGKRAIEIRNFNGVRVAIKSKIVETIGMGYKDIKINHASTQSYKDYKKSNPVGNPKNF